MTATECSDAELVSRTLAGDRDAFSRIVSRYQVLICSLAYSRIGNLGMSEDVAQETFITAWKHLQLLREPEKLRAWLCGIVRNRVHKSLQREGREPVHDAEPLEAVDDSPAREALPSEQAISREEEAILWRSLERIPELYREPLILFYREHQSVEHVAGELELSEDAVKQRLSRGRKLLQEEVQAFVENTLRRTAPGPGFSMAVLAVLPAVAGTAATAGVGVGAKSAAAAKSGFVATWLAPLAPFLGILAGIGASWLFIRNATTDRALRLKQITFVIVAWVLYLGLFIAGENTMHWLARHYEWSGRVRFETFACFYWAFLGATITVQLVGIRRMQARWQARVEAGEILPKPMTPMRPGTLAAVVAGLHLMMFSWLIRLAWNFHDPMGVAVLSGATLVLAVAAFFRARAAAGATGLLRVSGSHIALIGMVIVLTLNQRIDVWVASAYGVSVAEAHHLQPLWLVPVLSLAFVLWTTLVVALTRPKLRLGRA